MDAPELRPREDGAEPFLKHRVQLDEAQRLDREAQGPLGRERQLQRGAVAGPEPSRREQDHRLGVETAEGELEGVCRGAVEPLHVVDRDDKPGVGGKRAQGVQQTRRDGSAVRTATLDQQGDLERAALRRRKRYLPERLAEQVRKAGEGELRLALRRTGAQRPSPASRRLGDRGLPDRRLADSRLALDRDCARRRSRLQEASNRGELFVSADEIGGRCGHKPS